MMIVARVEADLGCFARRTERAHREIDERNDAVRHVGGYAGDDGPAGAGPDQDDVGEIFERHEIGDIVDVRFQADVATAVVGPLPKPGQRRGIDLMSVRPEPACDLGPTPTPKPGGMY
jgi:hypothetical protein